MCPVLHNGSMFIIHCTNCEELGHQHRQLVTNTHLLSIRRSPAGPIALVRCVAGHQVEHAMYAAPSVPASV